MSSQRSLKGGGRSIRVYVTVQSEGEKGIWLQKQSEFSWPQAKKDGKTLEGEKGGWTEYLLAPPEGMQSCQTILEFRTPEQKGHTFVLL